MPPDLMTTLEVMEENVRLPVAKVKPGFISAATEKLFAVIEPTEIVPTAVVAGVVPDTAASIVLPAAVCVITVHVPEA